MTKEIAMKLVAKMKQMEADGKQYETGCGPQGNRSLRWSAEYWDIHNQIEDLRVFKCKDCGEMVSYHALEDWVCRFDRDDYLCSCCYEEGMGEDL